MSLSDYITRWRHTLGYGVHSPLAYRIVKECLYPDSRYGFYSDAYIDYEFRNDRDKCKNARKLIRLINLLHPKRLWVPNCDKQIRTAISMSFPKLYVSTLKDCPKGCDMIVDYNDNELGKLWNRFDGMEECNLIAFSSRKKADISNLGNPPTLIMEGRNFLLLLRRKGMSQTSYLI